MYHLMARSMGTFMVAAFLVVGSFTLIAWAAITLIPSFQTSIASK